MINRQRFVQWLNLPPGDSVKLQKRGKRMTATVTTAGNTLTYWITETGGSYTLNDSANPTIVSDHNGSRDPEEYAEASVDSNIAETVAASNDTIIGELADRFVITAKQAEAVADWHRQQLNESNRQARSADLVELIRLLMSRPSAKVAAWGMAFASGLDCVAGRSMTSVAGELGVTRACISKEANLWADRLGLPRSRYMKSTHARQSYRQAQLRSRRGGRTNAPRKRYVPRRAVRPGATSPMPPPARNIC